MAFQPVGKVFQRQKNAKFIVAGSAVLERILSIVCLLYTSDAADEL